MTLRVCMLSGCDPAACYMARRLRAEGRLQHLIRIVWDKKPRARLTIAERVRRLTAKRVYRRLQSSWLDRHEERLVRAVARELFGSVSPEVTPDEIVESSFLREPGFADRLRAVRPDVLLVNGAPILGDHVLEVPNVMAINCHFGIAPVYRGSFTLFWALYRNDPDHLGATLHAMTRGVDAGPVLGYAYPRLRPGDGEATIMAGCTRAATELLFEVLDALERGQCRGLSQDRRCRAFRKADRHPWHDGALWLRSRVGLARLEARAARHESFLRSELSSAS